MNSQGCEMKRLWPISR